MFYFLELTGAPPLCRPCLFRAEGLATPTDGPLASETPAEQWKEAAPPARPAEQASASAPAASRSHRRDLPASPSVFPRPRSDQRPDTREDGRPLGPETERIRALRFELAELDLLLASVGRKLDREAILHPNEDEFIAAAERLREVQLELNQLELLLGPRPALPDGSPRGTIQEDVDAILERLLEESRGSEHHVASVQPGEPESRVPPVRRRRSPDPSGAMD